MSNDNIRHRCHMISIRYLIGSGGILLPATGVGYHANVVTLSSEVLEILPVDCAVLEQSHQPARMFGCVESHSQNRLLQRERERIKKDEERMDLIAELDSIRGVLQNTDLESCTQTGYAKPRKLSELTKLRENDLRKTTLTQVRRAALQSLLERENILYNAKDRKSTFTYITGDNVAPLQLPEADV
ncbi:hypothetical protein UPYG_G00156250 [Umbra pygmaea]|uniref:Uncharacterized protein n=1 Tax=Umbra pygmaea TaxID=75934 RepID=A0ABD0XGC8_UMBPY